MATKIEKRRGRIVEVVHEPGNMTRYRVVACEVRKRVWFVAAPDFGLCLEVTEGLCVFYDYVMEKAKKCRSKIDASEIAKAIALAVPHVMASGCTDERGNLIEGAL